MHRVDIDADFTAAQVGQAAAEGIDRQAFVGDLAVTGRKDVIVYAAHKKGRQDRYILGNEIQSQVSLQAVFRLQILVAYFIAEGAFVLAIGTQFGQIGGAETAGHIGPDGEVLSQRAYRSQAG